MAKNGIARKPERIVAIGASAGGIQAVLSILNALPEDFPAPILIVIHTSADSPGLLPAILQRRSRLHVMGAHEGLPLHPGTAYVACPGKHMLVRNGHLHITAGPFENRNRPAIDPTFRSVALEFGRGAIGVILTGYLDDGTAGLATIKRHGGKAVVQHPEDAEVPNMPQSALNNVSVDAVVPLAGIPEILLAYVQQEIAPQAPVPQENPAIPSALLQEDIMSKHQGSPSVFTCPDCHGTLWEVQDGKMLRFECRVGHAYSQDSMVEDQNDSTERALWAALRSLEESAQLSRRLLKRSEEMGQHLAVERYENRARTAEAHIAVFRRILGYVEPVPLNAEVGTLTSGV